MQFLDHSRPQILLFLGKQGKHREKIKGGALRRPDSIILSSRESSSLLFVLLLTDSRFTGLQIFLVCFPTRAPGGMPAPESSQQGLGPLLRLQPHRTGCASRFFYHLDHIFNPCIRLHSPCLEQFTACAASSASPVQICCPAWSGKPERSW